MQALPSLNSDYELTPEQILQYQRDGHLLLRQVCSAEEMAEYRDAIRAVVADFARTQNDLTERDTYGRAFLQLVNVWTQNALLKKFVFAQRFARLAAQLSCAQVVRLYHDQALFKESGGGLTPWHQDQHYWPLDTRQAITMWMPLVDVSQEMGSMDFASGSHANGYLAKLAISDQSQTHFQALVEKQGFPIFQSGDMRAGDATFHNGWTLHRAGPNLSQRVREVMTVIYYPDGTRLLQPDHANRREDFEAFYPGKKPGELAASELTPVLLRET